MKLLPWLAAGLLLAGDALAAPIMVDDFETGKLDRWTRATLATTCVSAGCTLRAEPTAAHRGAQGMALDDQDGSQGEGFQGEVALAVPQTIRSIYGRFWFRTTSSNGQGRAVVAQLYTNDADQKPILDLAFNPVSNTFETSGTDTTAGYQQSETAFPLQIDRWYLIEYEVTGLGTATGAVRGYIDGTLKTQLALNYTGVPGLNMALGEPWSYDRRFVGRFNFDDFRADTAPQASRFVLTPTPPTSPATAGSCIPVALTLASSSGGVPANAPYGLNVALSATGVAGVYFSDAACTTPAVSATLQAGDPGATVYFRPDATGIVALKADHPDLLSGSSSLVVTARGSGTGNDCPSNNPFCADDLEVGSSCMAPSSDAFGWEAWILLATGALTRCRRRR